MNKTRREKIKEIIKLLERANNILEETRDDEEFAFDNLSEGLQQTMRGEQMEENVNEMDDAIEKINDAIDNLNNVN